MAGKIAVGSFRGRVYEVVKRIPRGKVATYGQIAKLAGRAKAARAVGVLMSKNPDMTETPCHRVVGRDGGLVGYSGNGGLSGKERMLREEGVVFDGRRVDLKSSLWNEDC